MTAQLPLSYHPDVVDYPRSDFEDQPPQSVPPEILLARAQRRQRLRIGITAVPLLLALLWFLPPGRSLLEDLFVRTAPFDRTTYQLLNLIPIILLMTSGFGLLMIYLETGFKKTSASDLLAVQYDTDLSRRAKDQAGLLDDISKLKAELVNLKGRLDQPRTNQALTDDQRTQLAETLHQRLLAESAQELVSDLRNRLEASISQDERRKLVTTIFVGTLQRLKLEVDALGRRGNTNLAFGSVIAIAGLGLLGELVYRTTNFNPTSPLDLTAHYLPRITLVIFVEVFAYFFLKLYKSSLSEIKYFQNEMTNVESKQAALETSLHEEDKIVRPEIIKILANTERNSVLRKDETTVELERVKLDKDAIVEVIPKLLAPFTGKSK